MDSTVISTPAGQMSRRSQLSYGTFTLETVIKQFDLDSVGRKLSDQGVPIQPSDLLKAALARGASVAFLSEKARSEFIVAPILLEVVSLVGNNISILSGVRLDVAPEEGLQGICDFILSKAPPLPILRAPLMVMVEAKKGDIEEGLGQCAAEMIGAQRFNQREGYMIPAVYGCVTTGELWQFLKLEDKTLIIDPERLFIEHVDRILGVLVKMASS